jgi:UDP-N-acetyl-D-mannosaminuronate dehydrogenase
LTPLVKASQTLAKVVKKGDVVIYESTVYPGATEEQSTQKKQYLLPTYWNAIFHEL